MNIEYNPIIVNRFFFLQNSTKPQPLVTMFQFNFNVNSEAESGKLECAQLLELRPPLHIFSSLINV